jgi:hypothetical protein
MINGEMGDKALAGCFTWIGGIWNAPPDIDGRAKVLAIGFEVLGLEVFELAQEGHGKWQSCPSSDAKCAAKAFVRLGKKLTRFCAKAFREQGSTVA